MGGQLCGLCRCLELNNFFKHFYFSEVFWSLSNILSYCYTRLTRDLLCVLGRGCCKNYWLIWNQISTMLFSVYCIVCVHLCYRVSHGYFRLEKGSETTPPIPSPLLYAWLMCNRHRRKESINLILYELRLIFSYRHYSETITGNIVTVITRWEFKVQACYFSIVPDICRGICHNHIKLFITFWRFLYVFDTWL